ncbi:MAG: hypothetical protein HY097_00930 [Nitrospinae bacterium]|nr:hypothetical protein [Nitrospinota bacterium]
MKKFISLILVFLLAICFGVTDVLATPSTTYWTPATTDVQPYGVWHLGIDNYFTVAKTGADKYGFPTDVGLTVGVLPFEKINLEVGVDWLEPSNDPAYFNAKFAVPENALSEWSPALNVGIFNVGTDGSDTDGDGRTDQNIVHFLIGKSLGEIGRIHLGYYIGNDKVLLNRDGKAENTGFMIGYDRWIIPDKFMFAADYASGKNAIGAGGFGLYWFFSKNASLLVGPVWFNDAKVAAPLPLYVDPKAATSEGASWVFTTQLDINF